MRDETLGQDRGSEWGKWDLHVHTKYSWQNKKQYSNTTDEEFIKTIKESGLNVIGLTNYFNFSEKEIHGEDSLKSKLEKEGITVFLNLELRLSYENKEHELCDYHILFSPDISEEEIGTFLSNLDVKNGGEVYKASQLTEEQLKSNKLYVDFMHLKAVINQDSLNIKDKVLCGLLSRGKGESRSAKAYEYLATHSDFIIHSSDSEKNIEEDADFWIKQNNKPIYQSSDAHSLKEIGEKFTWIKAKKNLDGLKQTICEPSERISFNENEPYEKPAFSIISSIKFEDKKVVNLNPSLNSIIGKRGNGKSILLKAIALRADHKEVELRIKDRESINRIKDWDNKVFGNSAQIQWRDGTINDDKNKKILYIPQGYLSNLAYEENLKKKERDDFIVDLLNENELFKNAKEHADEQIYKIQESINKNIGTLVNEKETLDIIILENKKLGEEEDLRIAIKTLNEKIESTSKKKSITKAQTDKYLKAMSDIESITKELFTHKQDLLILNTIKNGKVVNINLVEESNRLSNDIKERILRTAEESGKTSTKEIISKEITKISQVIKSKKKTLNENEKTRDNLKEKFESQQEITELTKKLSKTKRILTNVISNKKSIIEKESNIKDITNNIIGLYFSYNTVQNKIYETIRIENLDYISILARTALDTNILSESLEKYVNCKVLYDAEEDTKLLVQSEKPEFTEMNIKTFLNDILHGKIRLKSSYDDKRQALSQLLANPYKIDLLSSITMKDSETSFRDMTGGQKAIAMLELIFKLDNNSYPILLDQPEDDLDTSGVSTSVVDFIKKQKQNRQIIMVSHSASLVVCSDSEEIIVCSQNDGKFKYETGAIEDEGIRDKIIDIMEGGKASLELRLKKLGIR